MSVRPVHWTVVGVLLAVVLPAMALALVDLYQVAPVTAEWSDWTQSGGWVSEVMTCNFDSLDHCELFAGDVGAGGLYRVTVYDGGDIIAQSDEESQGMDHSWVEFDSWTFHDGFVKGRQYEFRFTRGGGDSIEFYFHESGGGGSYTYGEMLVRGVPQPDKDLCMRCCGVIDTVDSTWRVCVNHGNDPASGSGGTAALEKAESIGVKWFRDDFDKWEVWAQDVEKVMGIYRRYQAREFSMTGVLCYGRTDTAISSCYRDSRTVDVDQAMHPPRNLFFGVNEAGNFWAGYCRSIMDSMPGVEYWEIWPEANAYWFWQDPDTLYCRDSNGRPIDTPRERCSLYVQMCYLAKQAASQVDSHPKVVAGATYRLFDNDGGVTVSSGVDWLRDVFDIAERRYGGAENWFDIVSVHPYMHYGSDRLHFVEDTFRINLDTARWVMRQAGHQDMELWATEYGWPRWSKFTPGRHLTDTFTQADNLGKFLCSAIGGQTDPRGGYDRAFWYELTGHHASYGTIIDNEGFGLLDSNPGQTRLPHSWAMQQLGDVLGGKRCNGRVLSGDVRDVLVRVYEFEDPATLRRT